MSIEDKIKKRMDDAVVKSYFKPWYKRWWGKIVIFILLLLAFLVLAFLYQIATNFINLKAGKLYVAETGKWITQEQFQTNQKELSYLLTEDDPWLGSEEPIIYVVSYESFGCPFCKENQKDIEQLIAKYGSVVRFIRKDFPTEGLHPNVFDAHLAAACANEQGKYWEYGKLLFSDIEDFKKDTLKAYAQELGLNKTQFEECLSSEKYAQEIRQDYANGIQLGVQGTPSYIINGSLVPGAIPIEFWDKIVGFIIKTDY